MFIGTFGIGKNRVIKQWLEEHKEIEPVELNSYDSDYNNVVIAMPHSDQLLYYIPRINWKIDDNFKSQILSILKNREYVSLSSKKYNLSNMVCLIATAYSNSMYDNLHELKDYFDVYNVITDVAEWGESFEKETTKLINNKM